MSVPLMRHQLMRQWSEHEGGTPAPNGDNRLGAFSPDLRPSEGSGYMGMVMRRMPEEEDEEGKVVSRAEQVGRGYRP